MTIKLNNLLSGSLVEIPKMLLLIDTGHGYNTVGKRTADGFWREYIYNQRIGAKVGMLVGVLKQMGYPIEMEVTSNSHYDEKLSVRTKRERDIFEKYRKTHVIMGISIHANGHTLKQASGCETYHFPNSKAVIFAEILQKKLIAHNGLTDRGVKYNSFQILRETKADWVLSEAGFFTNDSDLEKLQNEDFQNANATSMVEAAIEYAIILKKEIDDERQ